MRNLKSLSTEFLRYRDWRWVDEESFVNAVQIFKQPHDAAEIRRKAALRMSKTGSARTIFTLHSPTHSEWAANRAAIKTVMEE